MEMSYQNVTGTLSQGAHPGSYNGQDAYNDMFITERENDVEKLERRGCVTNIDNEQCGGVRECLIKTI